MHHTESKKRARSLWEFPRTAVKGHDGWMLVQAMQGKRPVTHVMIDAGMTRSKAKSLSVDGAGIKLVFSGQKDGPAGEGPFSSRTRWQPVFIAEMNEKKVYGVTDLDQRLFLGNPVMPVF